MMIQSDELRFFRGVGIPPISTYRTFADAKDQGSYARDLQSLGRGQEKKGLDDDEKSMKSTGFNLEAAKELGELS